MIACPACSAENPDRAKFCNECGASLAAPSPISEERKTVTTLFCDLVAFTAMSEAADPEDVDRILGEYFDRATKVIESHGGTVEKFIGDAVVGVFGVPAVHEDDPERAVRAALRILEALEGMTRPDGTPLEARCGVNTGEALVRLDVDPASGRGFLTGDAVNTAARLEASAPPGGVVVGALAHELTARVVEYRELPAVPAKGKAEPVRAWLAEGALARRGLDSDTGDLTPLVGREVELSYLSATFDKVMAQSLPQFALLVGEPGIGKSRLVRELFAHVDSQPGMTTWRQGYCPPFGEDITYGALTDIVKGHAGILDTDQSAAVEGKLEAVLPSGPDKEWFRQRLRALLGLTAPDASREENFMAWLRFFEDVAADQPTVLVFEDLHWADEALLGFLEYLTTRIAAVPLLIVGTARPELFEREPGFASGGDVTRIGLGPLSPAETARLVSGLLGEPDDRAKAVGEVVGRCDGNPFYAEQSARLLADSEPDASLPDSVQAVIAARLDTLPADQKALLGDAAVVGSVFWDGAVAAMGRREPPELEGALSGLLERRLIRRIRETSMGGEREFAFVHALARDVAYQQLPRLARAKKHVAIAHWIERQAGDRAEDLVEILAHHYLTACDFAAVIGDAELADSLVRPAVQRAAEAGEKAMQLDVQSARRHFERGLLVAGTADVGRGRLLCGLGEATSHAGAAAEAAELFREAAEAYRLEDDVTGEARAKWRQSFQLTFMCQPGAEELLAEALRLIETVAPCRTTLEILGGKVWQDWVRTERSADAIAGVDRIAELARQLGEPDPLVPMHYGCLARLNCGDAEAWRDLDRVLAAALARGHGPESALIMVNRACWAQSSEGPARTDQACRDVVEFARKRGLEELVTTAECVRVEALWLGGKWSAALELAEHMMPRLEAEEDVWDLLQLKVQTSLLLLDSGRVSSARPLVEWASSSGQASIVEFDAITLAAEARLAFAEGDTSGAHDSLTRWAELIYNPQDATQTVLAVIGVRLALGLGDLRLADRIAQTHTGFQALHDLAQHSMDALLGEARSEFEAASNGFDDAAARWRDFGMPYEEAQALLGQGRCLVALGRADEAAQPLGQAREIFLRLGAKPALEETEEWLEKLGVGL